MNVLIVENEKLAAEKLCRLLKKIDNSVNFLDITESVETTINWLQNNKAPELIFMDIQLDDGLCFELFEAVKIDIPVIFTTAFDQYMLSAFKVNSIDYLLKPIEEVQLRGAIDKFRLLYSERTVRNEILNNFLRTLNTGYKNRFLIKVGTNYKSIPVSDIACFYILERSVFIRLFSGKDYSIDYSLDYLQKVIDPDKFFRINRNCILNINAVSDILCYSSSRLEIKLNNNKPIDDLIVSRDKVGEFKKWIDK